MKNLEAIVHDAAALGAAQLAETLGLSAGEISQRKARRLYGKWFDDAEQAGRITPAHIDAGPNGTRHYRVVEVLEVRVADRMRAELQLENRDNKGRRPPTF